MPVTKAVLTDIPELEKLINSAYRGEESKKGWTSEADLLGGIRIDAATLHTYLNDEKVTILKYTDTAQKITGTVYLENQGESLYLGMLSVSPLAQGQNIGRTLLAEAEIHAKALNCSKIHMSVISVRKELISWYERRGYAFTGEIKPFAGIFGESDTGLEFIILEKKI